MMSDKIGCRLFGICLEETSTPPRSGGKLLRVALGIKTSLLSARPAGGLLQMSRMFLTIALAISFANCSAQNQVQIRDGVLSEGQECFKIETPNATYLYQKTAGGFSNILDRNGTDWVQFRKTEEATYPSSSASDYRGLPNLVFRSDDGGCGHPGFEKMTSEQISSNQIRSISNSGKWQWTWTFHNDFAELGIEKTDPMHAYWFLYEGPIAGKFSPSTHYWGTDKSGPLDTKPDLVKGPELYDHWQTVYFGDQQYEEVFFVHQIQSDTLKDLYTYMGNNKEKGNDSADGMVVFGFGRNKGATPLMTEPQNFRIGFYPTTVKGNDDHLRVIKKIRNLE